MVPTCKHCEQNVSSRPRGLCWGCYYKPGVKELYPVTSKFAMRGPGIGVGSAPLPAFPTTAAPGTPEKMQVIQRRLLLNQTLWHPDDAQYEGDPRPLLASVEAGQCELAHAA